MSVLQDIVTIARKALDDSSTVTESDIAPILSDALEVIIELCQMEQVDVAVYHKALNAVLPLFVLDRGYDYNCVVTGLRALALHPELPTDAKMAMKIHELGYGKEK